MTTQNTELIKRLRENASWDAQRMCGEAVDALQALQAENTALEVRVGALLCERSDQSDCLIGELNTLQTEVSHAKEYHAAELAEVTSERDRWQEDAMRNVATINRLAAAAKDRDEVDALRAKVWQDDLSKLTAERDELQAAHNIKESNHG